MKWEKYITINKENNYCDSQDKEPYIKIRNLSKKFDNIYAVDNINLDIHKGELFTILGGSGCGKSTLLRMIAGIELPESGSIEVDGHEMNGVAANERPINMMFQSYAVFPHMNVFKNIAYGLITVSYTHLTLPTIMPV